MEDNSNTGKIQKAESSLISQRSCSKAKARNTRKASELTILMKAQTNKCFKFKSVTELKSIT